ncbi:MAG: hypothetical protein VX876_03910 [Planctomycetota bacterium]|nr:hypothetical protein [Planctomycetota bacterium]
MDTKKRCTIVLCLLVTICAGLWLSGNENLKEGALDILLRVTIFFAIFRLAYDDLVNVLGRLRGPTGILVGIAIAFAIINGPSVRLILPVIGVALILLGIMNTLRRSYQRDTYNPN